MEQRSIVSLKDINRQYGLALLKGGRVYCDNRYGTITGASASHIRVRFDGRVLASPCDPLAVRVVDQTDISQPVAPLTRRQ